MNVKRTNIKTGFLLLASMLFLSACGGSGGGDGGAPAPTSPTSRLFVSGFARPNIIHNNIEQSFTADIWVYSGTPNISFNRGG